MKTTLYNNEILFNWSDDDDMGTDGVADETEEEDTDDWDVAGEPDPEEEEEEEDGMDE